MGDMADWSMEQNFDEEDSFYVQEPVHVKVIKIVRETDQSWLLQLSSDRKEWFPKSRCTLDIEENEILIPQWLADRKNLRT